MLHLPDLIRDLGVILAAAAVVTLLCKFFRQQVVLGYLIAGFLVSRHVPYLPTVKDEASVKVWAEIGVIFLLFGLGLEFSFKKLAKVGRRASITGLFEVTFMLCLGFLLGRALGWSHMDSLFLGGILSISSTTIIVRAFSELNMKGRKFVSLVFGVLIVEDLVAVLLLVLLSTIAVTQSFTGTELVLSGLRLGFFLVLWFLVGIYAVPQLLAKIRRHLSDETTLIVSLGLCLSMVLLATEAGFSPALGAFVMGSILAETSEGKRMEHLVSSVRDLFGAVFFVSVGMLIDPAVIAEHFPTIVIVTLAVICGKLLSVVVGALLSGESLKTSVQAGMSMAQIGEFSFIIATLGLSLQVTSDFLYPIAVSASAITTFTTPYMIKYADHVYHGVIKIMPSRLQDMLAHYHSTMSRDSEKRLPALLWRAYGVKAFLNAVIVVAITLGVQRALLPKLDERFFERPLFSALLAFMALIFSAPFLWAIVFGAAKQMKALSREEAKALEGARLGVITVRFLAGLALATFVVLQFELTLFSAFGVLTFFSALMLVWNKFAKGVYTLVEDRFVSNLNESGEAMPSELLAPWDASLSEVVISPHSEFIAKSLQDSKLKEKFGVTIGMIERGKKKILAPGRAEILLPYDRIFLIGTEDQIGHVRPVMEANLETIHSSHSDMDAYGLDWITLTAESPFVGKAIRDAGIREEVNGLIVGIERSGQRILNPDSTLELKSGDMVWLVGDKNLIRKLRAQ